MQDSQQFEFNVEYLLRDILSRHAGMEEYIDAILDTCGQLEQTWVFHELPRSSQLREVQAWLTEHYYLQPVLKKAFFALALDTMYRHWVVQDISRDDNKITTDFGKMSADFLQLYGMPVSLSADYYGWQDYDAIEDFKHVTVVGIYDIGSDQWSEFEGTFVEDTVYSGFSAYVVLENGVERYMRSECSLAEVMQYFSEHAVEHV